MASLDTYIRIYSSSMQLREAGCISPLHSEPPTALWLHLLSLVTQPTDRSLAANECSCSNATPARHSASSPLHSLVDYVRTMYYNKNCTRPALQSKSGLLALLLWLKVN